MSKITNPRRHYFLANALTIIGILGIAAYGGNSIRKSFNSNYNLNNPFAKTLNSHSTNHFLLNPNLIYQTNSLSSKVNQNLEKLLDDSKVNFK
jgi:hypothetical protein